MNKHERYFLKIQEFKQRFRKMSSVAMRYRLGTGSLIKEAEIAYREILEERGEPVYLVKHSKPESTELPETK